MMFTFPARPANFDFYSVGRIIFGRGRFADVGQVAGQFGKSALVVHNADRLVERAERLLAAAGVRAVFLRQRGEPQVADVDRGVEMARAEKSDLVIGLGGGSAIDAAKAVAGLLGNGGSALDYMEVIGRGLKITRPAAPWVAIPTTAGTGAEATRNAVIGYPPRQFKASIRSEFLLACVALVDPELGVDVRPEITACSGMDALCQLIESFTSNGGGAVTDGLAVKGIHLAAQSLRRAYENGHDIDAREKMATAALLSGIALTNAGLGAVHGFAAPMGANYPAPHGAICAALLPHVLAANIDALKSESAEHPVLLRYAQIGQVLKRPPLDKLHMPDFEAAVDACVSVTAELVRDLKIPPLSEYGLTAERIPEMAALAAKSSSMRYNPVVLPQETLKKILRDAIGQS